MINVVGVRFKKTGKIYYFSPNDLQIENGQELIVETSRGIEFGFSVSGIKQISESELVSELKPVLRIADENDKENYKINSDDSKSAMNRCKEIVCEHQLEMNLIDCEYTFDRNKLIFYFTAEGRVDFRNLVKDLASEFRTRIELRQVGVRDEAKLLGGIGPCGKRTCCSSWMGDFAPVSIKMAKEQNLSLNPSKISGVCGRLMCCLKYEYEHYLHTNRVMPKTGEIIDTPSGKALTMISNPIKEEVSVKLIKEFNAEENRYELEEEILKFKNSEIKRDKNKCVNCPKNSENIDFTEEDDDFDDLDLEDLKRLED